jgi:recombinational DNA repair protein RecR
MPQGTPVCCFYTHRVTSLQSHTTETLVSNINPNQHLPFLGTLIQAAKQISSCSLCNNLHASENSKLRVTPHMTS